MALAAAAAAGACAPTQVLSPADEFLNAKSCQIGDMLDGSLEQGVFRANGMPIMEFLRTSPNTVAVSLLSMSGQGLATQKLQKAFGSGEFRIDGDLGVFRAVAVGDPQERVVMSCKTAQVSWLDWF